MIQIIDPHQRRHTAANRNFQGAIRQFRNQAAVVFRPDPVLRRFVSTVLHRAVAQGCRGTAAIAEVHHAGANAAATNGPAQLHPVAILPRVHHAPRIHRQAIIHTVNTGDLRHRFAFILRRVDGGSELQVAVQAAAGSNHTRAARKLAVVQGIYRHQVAVHHGGIGLAADNGCPHRTVQDSRVARSYCRTAARLTADTQTDGRDMCIYV